MALVYVPNQEVARKAKHPIGLSGRWGVSCVVLIYFSSSGIWSTSLSGPARRCRPAAGRTDTFPVFDPGNGGTVLSGAHFPVIVVLSCHSAGVITGATPAVAANVDALRCDRCQWVSKSHLLLTLVCPGLPPAGEHCVLRCNLLHR